MKRWILGALGVALCASLSLPAFDVAAAPSAPADQAISDEAISDEDRPAGDTPDWVVGEMLCARPR